MLFLVNQEKFMPGKYGEESIFRYSQIYRTQIDSKNPNWIDSEILMTELTDEVAIVNLGMREQT